MSEVPKSESSHGQAGLQWHQSSLESLRLCQFSGQLALEALQVWSQAGAKGPWPETVNYLTYSENTVFLFPGGSFPGTSDQRHQTALELKQGCPGVLKNTVFFPIRQVSLLPSTSTAS